MSAPVRVRFAPSPTGLLHVGGARTAIFNYLLARRTGGTFILRIEDTDIERSKKEWEEEILFSMKWLGLAWNEGPFYQTKRFDLYRDYAKRLVASGHAYACDCSPEDVEEMRRKAEAEGRKPMYDRRCRERGGVPEGKAHVLRFKTPLSGETVVNDAVYGDVKFGNVEIDDFVILRSNGAPTYNFTVVVDDIDMKISHVIRGDDHLNNTPKQILIMKAFGWTPPTFAHIPLILAPDKTKLSKRHGAVAVSQFREEGYLADAMVNCLARLGWSHGDQEIFSRTELETLFDLKGCGNSGAVFDRAKLDNLNAHYIKQLPLEKLVELVKELKANGHLDLGFCLKSESGKKILKAMAERAVRLTDFPKLSAWLVRDDFEKDQASVDAALTVVKPGAMEALRELLGALPTSEFTSDKIAPLFKEAAAKIGGKMPDVAKPARVLLTGTLQSPDIGLVVEALGKEKALARLSAR